jgi:hypothetical protein
MYLTSTLLPLHKLCTLERGPFGGDFAAVVYADADQAICASHATTSHKKHSLPNLAKPAGQDPRKKNPLAKEPHELNRPARRAQPGLAPSQPAQSPHWCYYTVPPSVSPTLCLPAMSDQPEAAAIKHQSTHDHRFILSLVPLIVSHAVHGPFANTWQSSMHHASCSPPQLRRQLSLPPFFQT